MSDFKQDYCLANQYDNKKELFRAAGTNITHGMIGALVVVEGGRLRIRRSDGVTLDVAVSDVSVNRPRKVIPSGIGIDVAGHFWMIEFSRVHKSRQMREGGLGSKIASASAFGNFKAMKVGKQLREEFVASLRSQGATEAAED